MIRAITGPSAVTRVCLTLGPVLAAFGLAGPFASPAAAADSCPNAAVRAQQNATRLPDCRAYELVNPSGNDIGEVNRVPNMSDDGNTVVYTSVVLGNDALGGGTSSISVARRGTDGWTSTSADPTSLTAGPDHQGTTEVISFSSDYSKALLMSTLSLVGPDVDVDDDYYVVDVGRGTSKLMSQGILRFPFSPIGATANLDRVVFDVVSSPSEDGIYASDGTTRQLLSVDENGTPFASPVAVGKASDRGLGVGVGGGSHRPFVERGGSHGASDDTQLVYFYGLTTSDLDLGVSGPLYLNDHGASTPVSASQRTGDVGTVHLAVFISASRNGSTLYFNSTAQLTDTATPGGGIYRFDVPSRTLTLLTPDAGEPTGLHMLGGMASDDQSHIYFTSTSDLAPGATVGSNNAYVWTEAGGVRFIATLGGGDLIHRVTPDGRFALVLSSTSIGGAPTDGRQALYRYDDATRQLTCVSCRPDGSPSQGSADLDSQGYGIPNAPNYHNRAITKDGSVVFTSTDRLVPDDQTDSQDVYIYRDGGVSLLTSGAGDSPSFIGDVSDDAKNVVVVTRSALVAADQDAEEFDVYDVRVDGGFLTPPPLRDPCRGDDCQGPAAPQVRPAEPGSSRVTSPGNVPMAKVVKKVGMSRLTASQRSTLARTGKVTLSVRVTGGGTVSIRGRGRVGGKTTTVGRGSGGVLKRATTTAKVTFRLTTAAQRELSRKHRLSLTLQTRLSGVSKAVTSIVNLSHR
jgi:hypothetical protein